MILNSDIQDNIFEIVREIDRKDRILWIRICHNFSGKCKNVIHVTKCFGIPRNCELESFTLRIAIYHCFNIKM